MIEFKKTKLLRIPAWIASVLMILFTTLWTYWGANEMYHEGWWGAWYNRLSYLVPIAVTLIPALVAFRWPIVGGILIMLIGTFALFFFSYAVAFIGLAIALVGVAFLVDGFVKRRARSEEVTPEGPGWNWRQSWGGYPSWQSIALYGVAPVGLEDKPGYGPQGEKRGTRVFASGQDMVQTNPCRYLNADGTTLLHEPQNIWRTPTTDEIVRSLGRHGENAGCKWQGEFGQQVMCAVLPDKESPLWSTDQPVIYYWTADSYSEDLGYFVAYNAMVNAASKVGGNPRHGYRCVKEP
jgi:hypothetical protein